MAAPDAVLELVERFARNREQYLNPAYNETQVRREFIDPLFAALGWDVDNRSGYAQQYKDVVHEDAIKIGVDTRAPDYSFRIGGVRKFFVEAKKPAVNLKDDPGAGLPATPLRLVGQAAAVHPHRLPGVRRLRLPRASPRQADKPSVARTLYVPVRAVRRALGGDRRRVRQGGDPPGLLRPLRRVDQGQEAAPPRSTRPSSRRSRPGATRSHTTSPCATPRSRSAS